MQEEGRTTLLGVVSAQKSDLCLSQIHSLLLSGAPYLRAAYRVYLAECIKSNQAPAFPFARQETRHAPGRSPQSCTRIHFSPCRGRRLRQFCAPSLRQPFPF